MVILLRSMYGYLIKWLYDLKLLRIPTLGEREQSDVIVSLTSYGRRVKRGVVCYSVYSILRQTLQPKRIILWLSETEWNDTNLPESVAALCDKGVEIRYCEDWNSYKKLLPTLQLCPDDTVITTDDDLIYPKELISELSRAHSLYPQAIVAPYMYVPIRDDKGYAPYLSWPFDTPDTPVTEDFIMGGTGCLYPPHSLREEMLDYTLALQYAPLADDVWFWAAGIANGTKKYRTNWCYPMLSFDAIYQYLHRGSALQHSNVKGNVLTNDMQIAATMKYIKERYGVG
ncbi:MAG: hypothetical protein J6Y00_01480 [Paludibacteraceae bacterium]|nr:hypothetical protein [Paludibacteraceae bacterium]